MEIKFNGAAGKISKPVVVSWEVTDKEPFKIESVSTTCGCTVPVFERTTKSTHIITATVTKHTAQTYNTTLTMKCSKGEIPLPLKIEFT